MRKRTRRRSSTPEDIRFFGAGCACVALLALGLCGADSLTGHAVSRTIGIRTAHASVPAQALTATSVEKDMAAALSDFASAEMPPPPQARVTLAALTSDPVPAPAAVLPPPPASVPDLAPLQEPAEAALPPAPAAPIVIPVAPPAPTAVAPVAIPLPKPAPLAVAPAAIPLPKPAPVPHAVATAPAKDKPTETAAPHHHESAPAVAAIPMPAPAPRRPPPPPTPAQRLGLDGKARARAEQCLARAVYFEARGEHKIGQVAVAQVVMNRVFSPYYPNDVCGVIYQNAHHHLACQFTFACDGKSKRITEPRAWMTARQIAKLTLDGKIWVPAVAKATHYHAVYVHPVWTREMHKLVRYGIHNFYRPWNWGDGRDETMWSNVVHTVARAKIY